jgi:hypothetical protein
MIYKTLHRKLTIKHHEPHKNWGWAQMLWKGKKDYPFGIFKLFLPLQSIWAQPVFCGVHGALLLVFCVVFCRSLLLGFFCRLYCLSLDDLRILLIGTRRVWRYQSGNQNPYVEGKTIQWTKKNNDLQNTAQKTNDQAP